MGPGVVHNFAMRGDVQLDTHVRARMAVSTEKERYVVGKIARMHRKVRRLAVIERCDYRSHCMAVVDEFNFAVGGMCRCTPRKRENKAKRPA